MGTLTNEFGSTKYW